VVSYLSVFIQSVAKGIDIDKLLQISKYPIFIYNTDNICKIC
jgi:hypothetical protein